MWKSTGSGRGRQPDKHGLYEDTVNSSEFKEHSEEEVRCLITAECDAIEDMLFSKNQAYGNSALDPLRIFSKASTREQILVRIDDKLSRIVRGSSVDEDVVLDLIGYLVLLRVADKMVEQKKSRMGDLL